MIVVIMMVVAVEDGGRGKTKMMPGQQPQEQQRQQPHCHGLLMTITFTVAAVVACQGRLAVSILRCVPAATGMMLKLLSSTVLLP